MEAANLACGAQMPDHNVLSFVTALSAKLATRSRHVCAFLGAGVGMACGLPDVKGLQQHVLNDLRKDDRAAFNRQLAGRDLEGALSRHFPDDIQIRGNRTTVPPPRERHPFGSHRIA